jgi:uncharacterized membrane protein YciS (DUF1049 family)
MEWVAIIGVFLWSASGIISFFWMLRGQEVTLAGLVAILGVGAIAGAVIPAALLIVLFMHLPLWDKPVRIWSFERKEKNHDDSENA